ncbi:hypothetical protein Hanom_Chr16g01458081 [Helianthus anomalus]
MTLPFEKNIQMSRHAHDPKPSHRIVINYTDLNTVPTNYKRNTYIFLEVWILQPSIHLLSQQSILL